MHQVVVGHAAGAQPRAPEEPPDVADDGPADARLDVVPVLAGRIVLVADVRAPEEGHLGVDHQELLVVARVQAPALAPGRDRPVDDHFDAARAQLQDELLIEAERAHRVVDQAHLDPATGGLDQGPLEPPPGAVGAAA